MKVLLTHSYFLQLDPKETANQKPYPPLAPLQLAALMQKELNITPYFYDVMFDETEKPLIAAIEKYQPDVLLVYDDDFNYLTKMCLENMRRAILAAVQSAHFEGIAVAHGSDASDQAETYLQAGFDFVVHRNAEQVVLDMLKNIRDGRTGLLSELPSLSFLAGNRYCRNEAARGNYPAEQLPIPAWPLIDLTPYRETWQRHYGYFSLNVSTAHGCPYRCNWCAKPLYGRTYKAIPPRRIAEEFAYLKNELEVQHLWITDDIFGLKPGWLAEFARAINELQATIPFKIQARADMMDENYVRDLARSGCSEVWLGVESGSQKILDAMQKDTSIGQIETATRLLKGQGIAVGYFLQYGYPGESWTEIKMTLALLKRTLPEHIGISVSYPLKDTPFYEQVAAQMGEKKTGGTAAIWH